MTNIPTYGNGRADDLGVAKQILRYEIDSMSLDESCGVDLDTGSREDQLIVGFKLDGIHPGVIVGKGQVKIMIGFFGEFNTKFKHPEQLFRDGVVIYWFISPVNPVYLTFFFIKRKKGVHFFYDFKAPGYFKIGLFLRQTGVDLYRTDYVAKNQLRSLVRQKRRIPVNEKQQNKRYYKSKINFQNEEPRSAQTQTPG